MFIKKEGKTDPELCIQRGSHGAGRPTAAASEFCLQQYFKDGLVFIKKEKSETDPELCIQQGSHGAERPAAVASEFCLQKYFKDGLGFIKKASETDPEAALHPAGLTRSGAADCCCFRVLPSEVLQGWFGLYQEGEERD